MVVGTGGGGTGGASGAAREPDCAERDVVLRVGVDGGRGVKRLLEKLTNQRNPAASADEDDRPQILGGHTR
jgi:hypothetical protein